MPCYKTVIDILQTQAAEQPHQLAFRFLADGEQESGQWTYQQLAQQAQAIATTLLNTFSMGDRLVLVYPDSGGLDFIAAFFGCLYAGIIAVPMNPTRNQKSIQALIERLEHCGAKAVLTNHPFQNYLANRVADDDAVKQTLWAIPWINTDEIDTSAARTWRHPAISPEHLAFLQYTSGSTGQPKGAMVTHQNLIHNSKIIYTALGHSPQSSFVSWLPLFHDMGLIGGMLQPLYGGFPCTLIPPNIWNQKPLCWLKAISKYRATTSGGPNFAYDVLARNTAQRDLNTLDLSTWSVAFSGSETVRASTLAHFSKRFAAAGFQRSAFYPCYGMAETTLFVTGALKEAEPTIHTLDPTALKHHRADPKPDHLNGVQVVSCGKVWGEDRIKIVNTQSSPGADDALCPPNHVGEIWIASDSVTAGYWQAPKQTEETFQASLGDLGPFLRSGDLGFLDESGELFVTGRIKDILSFRGRYHYPNEIEATVASAHEAIRPDSIAAFSLDIHNDDRLILAVEIERRFLRALNRDVWSEAIKESVFAHHGLAVYDIIFLKTGSIPRTTSGKIKRQACREGFIRGTLNSLS